MRLPAMKLQRFMVAVVFLAIALWAGPVVLPEFALRWARCHDRARVLQSDAVAWSWRAARLTAGANHRRAAIFQRKADLAAREARKYRRALYLPWECWALGD
jgi:hypothetical protein